MRLLTTSALRPRERGTVRVLAENGDQLGGQRPVAARLPFVHIGVLAGAYFATAKLGIDLDVSEGVVTPVWVPSGLSLAALLLFGWRLWPGIAIGAFAANATSDVSVVTAAGIAAGNTGAALVAVGILRRVPGFQASLSRAQDVIALVVAGALLSTLVSATVGTSTLLVADEIGAGQYRFTWFLWWFGDAIGDVIVAPLVLAWAARSRRPLRGKVPEGLVLLVALLVLSTVVFSGDRWRYPYVIFPLLVWAAGRFDVRGTATANFVVTAIAVWGTVGGSVLMEGATGTETVQILQALVGVVAVSMLVLAASIGEREEAEEALERSFSLLRGTLDSTADGLLVVDLDGRMVSYNQRFVDMWRIPDEIVSSGSNAAAIDFVLDQLADPDAFLDRLRHLYSSPEDESHDVLVFKDGRVFERYSRPQRVGGDVVGRVWSFSDVSDARRLEILQRRFLDMATHEMRTPLGVISGFARLMLDDWAVIDDDTKQDYLRRMIQQADRLARVSAGLLLASRADAGKLEPKVRAVDLRAVVEQAVGDLQAEGITVSCPEMVRARADADYVHHMAAHFLTNAVKFGQTPIWVEVGSGDGCAEVRVFDAGPGVPPELAERLFDRFSGVREARNPRAPGSGLGLWTARELARAQGGDVWYEQHDAGCCFGFRLPLSRAGDTPPVKPAAGVA